jgi:hypothetical protein
VTPAHSPETHVCVGMFRPHLDEAIKQRLAGTDGTIRTDNHNGTYSLIRWPEHIREHVREEWIAGRFDTPVYVTKEEALREKLAREQEA